VCTEEIPRTILTSDAFWDIDVFRVDFLPSGTRQNADTNHLFLSRDWLPQHRQSSGWQAGRQAGRQAMTLMVAKSMTLRSAGGQQRWRETMIKCSRIRRMKGERWEGGGLIVDSILGEKCVRKCGIGERWRVNKPMNL
jgi:hypothetical protein